MMDQMIHEHLAVGQKALVLRRWSCPENSVSIFLSRRCRAWTCSAARTWAAPSSRACTSWADDSNGRGLMLPWRSRNEGVVRIVRPKPASCATCGASLPMRHGLGMRGVIFFVGGDALEHRARLLSFFVEFRLSSNSLMGMIASFRQYNHISTQGALRITEERLGTSLFERPATVFGAEENAIRKGGWGIQ